MPNKNREKANEWNKEYRKKNSDKLKAKAREKYAENPDAQKSATLKYKFKITLGDYDRMLEEQGSGCAICGSLDSGGRGRFHVDHDHSCCPTEKTCGKCIRGLLCSQCNVRLGVLESEWKEKAEKYLGKWSVTKRWN